jgi:hypothetical protein
MTKRIEHQKTTTLTLTALTGGNWKTIYTDGSGDVTELSLGSAGQVFTSNGASSAPSWQPISLPIAQDWNSVLSTGATSSGVDPLVSTGDELQFRDTAIHISSETDGHMDIDSDISLDFQIGGTEQIILKDGVLEPTTDNDVDLGSADKKFKESFQYHAQTQPAGRNLSTGGGNNVYRNTTGHPIIVYGSIECGFSDNPTNIDLGWFECFTDSSTPPTTSRMKGGISSAHAYIVKNSLYGGHWNFYMIVADNDYYKIEKTTAGIGTVTIDSWNEVDF